MKQVLVVDDNRTNTRIIEVIVKGGPFELDITLSPEEGLSRLGSIPYDFALIDVFMPRMSGIELVRKWQETRNPDHTPRIVFITADTKFSPAREGFFDLGARVVRKPLSARALLSALR